MANEVFIKGGTTILKWADSGGDEVITLVSLATLVGRNGAMHDFGDVSRARLHSWLFFCQFATPPVVGEAVEIYWREGHNDAGLVHPSNDDGTGDIALSNVDKLKNLKHIGTLIVDEATTAALMAVYGTVDVNVTHGGPTIFNRTVDSLHGTAANNGFWMWPANDELQ